MDKTFSNQPEPPDHISPWLQVETGAFVTEMSELEGMSFIDEKRNVRLPDGVQMPLICFAQEIQEGDLQAWYFPEIENPRYVIIND